MATLQSVVPMEPSEARTQGELLCPEAFQAHGPAFADALRRREPSAVASFFDRHHKRVDRVLCAVLGPDPDIPDLVQEVFVQAIDSLPKFRGETESLGPWITRIAVFTARRCIRSRRRRWWLRPSDAAEGVEVVDPGASPPVADQLRRAYEVIAQLPADERIAFTLRFADGLALREVADACDVSLATIKRRISRGRARFEEHAAHDPFLREWLTLADR